MKKHLFLFLLGLCVPPPPGASGSSTNMTKVIQERGRMTWWQAQYHCRDLYSDLLSAPSAEQPELEDLRGWVDSGSTKERRRRASRSTLVQAGAQSQAGKCPLKNISMEKVWCGHQSWPLCVDDTLLLVQEMKTWEEALKHCRGLQGLPDINCDARRCAYDLVSLSQPEVTLLRTPEDISMPQVWVGLRFLATRWMWLNGRPWTGSDLQDCPDMDRGCAALDLHALTFKEDNCGQRRHFICHVSKTKSFK